MTHETKTFVDLTDILSLQMECLKCGTKYARPIMNRSHLPLHCPSCGTGQDGAEWFSGNQDSDRVALIAFLEQLQRISSPEVLKSLAAKHLRVRLEITPSVPQKSELVP